MVEITSEFSNKKYTLYDVSPTVFNLIVSNDTNSEESIELRQRLAALAELVKMNEDIAAKNNLPESELTPLKAQIEKDKAELVKVGTRLTFITKIKPSTMCEVLRTFVAECDGKSDKEIVRLGADLDLLYIAVQNEINKDADRFERVISKFRLRQNSNNKPSGSGA